MDARAEGPEAATIRRRWALAAGPERAQVLGLARQHLATRLLPAAVERWMGVPWTMATVRDGLRPDAEFPGQPGRGISCSWFVARVLGDSGIRLDTARAFAGAIAVDIQHGIAGSGRALWRRRGLTAAQLRDAVAAMGEGFYVLGLSHHVGLLHVGAGRVDFVHASYLPPYAVVREPVATSPAIADSTYFVVSPLLSDLAVTTWLERRALPFRALPRRASRSGARGER